MGKWILPDGRTTDYICRECTSTQCKDCRIRELEATIEHIGSYMLSIEGARYSNVEDANAHIMLIERNIRQALEKGGEKTS